jgi:GNAT superfamily N-acetyltransferase
MLSTTTSLRVAVDESPSAEDIGLVARGMRRHALAQISGEESPPIACFARDERAVVGGIVGRIIKRRMFVDLLWVEEARRGRGLGTALLQSMERVAGERGCRDVMLETLSGPAARLYETSGYRLLAQIPDYIPGFAKRVLLKSLA